MKRLRIITIIVFALVFLSVYDLRAEVGSSVHLPPLEKMQVDKKAMNELMDFYDQIEVALHAEDNETLMTFYSEDYLHHGITRRQLRFMWLEIFNNFDKLYSAHIFTKIDLSGKDFIITCTGGLFGIPQGSKTGDYETVDSWSDVNHWLTRIDGEWKMVGGGTHSQPGALGLKLHPLF